MMSRGVLTDKREKNRQEDEAVKGANADDPQVHPEVEHAEDLRVRKAEGDDAAELGQRDAGQHLGFSK
jgi:hypothetical protein